MMKLGDFLGQKSVVYKCASYFGVIFGFGQREKGLNKRGIL